MSEITSFFHSKCFPVCFAHMKSKTLYLLFSMGVILQISTLTSFHIHSTLSKWTFRFSGILFIKTEFGERGNLMNIERVVSKGLNLSEKSKVQNTHTQHTHTHTLSVFFCFPELSLVSLNSSWRINSLTLKNQLLSYGISSCSSWKIFLALI